MLEYERLKQNDLFTTIKRNAISDNTLKTITHDVRSLSKYVNDIVSDDRKMNNGIIGFVVT